MIYVILIETIHLMKHGSAIHFCFSFIWNLMSHNLIFIYEKYQFNEIYSMN